MKKLVVLLCLASLTVAGSGFAQADPDPNGIGLYFDADATITCVDLAPDFVNPQMIGYLVITNPTESSGIAAFECNLSLVGAAALGSPQWTVPAINVGTGGDLLVGFSAPLPAAPVVVLAQYSATIFAPAPAQIFITPVQNTEPTVPGEMVYSPADDPGNFQILRQSTGGIDVAVFVINGDCPVASDNDTWGGVKSMYR